MASVKRSANALACQGEAQEYAQHERCGAGVRTAHRLIVSGGGDELTVV
jgi:hypothetical protein|eukprot:COSAG06_NODE_341_length_17184_cov_10.318525_16_plen_49_part_00